MAQDTERDKMLRGEWYDANFDEALLKERLTAERYCYTFNQAMPGSEEQQEALKNLLGGEIPDGLSVLAPVYFDYGGTRTKLGTGTFVNHGAYFMDGGGITIGKNVFIGPFCGFYTATHPKQGRGQLLVRCERLRAARRDDWQRLRDCSGQRRDKRCAG